MTRFRYKDSGSPVHRLNPLAKVGWVLAILVLTLLFNSPLYLFLLFLTTLPLVAMSRMGREWASFIKLALILSLLIIFVNGLVNYNGTHVLAEAPFRLPVMGTPQLTLEALVSGVANSFRLLAIISAFAIFNLTVHPDDLLRVMLKLRMPYKSVLVTSLSTRFVPTLIDDIERISDAQRARGLELDRGNLAQRVRNRISIVIPLLSNSLDRTVQVAEAMEARGFGSAQGRTSYRELVLSRFDVVTLVPAIAALALGIFMRLDGMGKYRFYPTLDGINLSNLEWVMLACLLVILLSISPLAAGKRRVDLG